MYKKNWLFVFVFFLVFTSVSTVLATHVEIGVFSNEDTVDTIVKQNGVYDGKIFCIDANEYPCSTSVVCNITVIRPNSSYAIQDQRMTRAYSNVAVYNYTLPFPASTPLGIYNTFVHCASNPSTSGATHFRFIVETSEGEPTDAQSNIYAPLIIFLMLLAAVFLYVGMSIDEKYYIMKLFLVGLGLLFINLAVNMSTVLLEAFDSYSNVYGTLQTAQLVVLWSSLIIFGYFIVMWLLSVKKLKTENLQRSVEI